MSQIIPENGIERPNLPYEDAPVRAIRLSMDLVAKILVFRGDDQFLPFCFASAS